MRIAVSNPDNIGDFVVRQPMLAALAAAGHELLLIVRTHVAPLAAWAVPGATIVQCVADPYQPQFQVDAAPDDRLVKALTAFDPDIFVVASFQHTQLEEQLAQRLPRAKAIGFGGELFQNDKSRNITHVPAINLAVQVQVGRDWLEARKNEVLASAILGTSVTLPPPRLAAEKRFLTAAAGRLRQEGFSKRKFWIVCAGEGSPYTRLKNWSLEKWAEVCRSMVRDHGLHLVFVGTPAEHESTAAIRSQMGELAGKTIDMTATPDGLDMLVGLTAYSEGYLGKDTGPMHIAAALGKPVVAVFGGGHWPRFLPSPAVGKVLSMQVPCSDCNWFCPYKTSYCVKTIPVDAVQDAIRAVLTGQQTEFEVALLEPEPWVARAMILDAAEIGRDALRTLESERANFHQWHSDRIRDIDGLRLDLTRVEESKTALALERDELSRGISQLRDTTLQDASVRQSLQQALDTRNQELARINEELARLSDHAAVIDSDRASLQRLLTQRESEVARLTERATVSAAQVEIANKQADSLTESIARQTAQFAEALARQSAQFAETLAGQSVRLAEVQSQLVAQQANDASLQRLLATSEEEVARLSALSAAAAERLDAALADCASLRDANQHLDQECAQRAAALDAALASLDQIESRYQGAIADLRHQLRRAEDQLRSLLTLVPDLRDELARCLAEVARIPAIEHDQAVKQVLIDQLTQSLEAIELDHEDRLVLINSLSANLADVEADRQAKQEVIDALSTHLAEVETDRQARQVVIDALSANLAEVEADRQARQEVIDALSTNLAEVEADRQARQSLIVAISDKLTAVEADQQAKQEVIDHLVASLESANATIDDQRLLLARTESALEDHQQLVAQRETTIGNLSLRIEGLHQQIAEIEADRDARLRLIERISADLAAIDADRANRGRQIELLHAHIEHQQAEIARIESSLLPRRLVNLVRKG